MVKQKSFFLLTEAAICINIIYKIVLCELTSNRLYIDKIKSTVKMDLIWFGGNIYQGSYLPSYMKGSENALLNL